MVFQPRGTARPTSELGYSKDEEALLKKIPDRIDSKFRYVLLSAARAEQMIQGSSMTAEGKGPKFTRVAMDEITSDEVEWDYGPAPEPAVDETAAEAEGEASADDAKA